MIPDSNSLRLTLARQSSSSRRTELEASNDKLNELLESIAMIKSKRDKLESKEEKACAAIAEQRARMDKLEAAKARAR